MTCLTNGFLQARTEVDFDVRSRVSIVAFYKARRRFAANAGMVMALSVIISAVSSDHGPDPVMFP